MTNINGTTIKAGDVNIMCIFDSKPEVNDVIQFGTKEYNCVSIDEVNPDGNTVLYYTIQGR